MCSMFRDPRREQCTTCTAREAALFPSRRTADQAFARPLLMATRGPWPTPGIRAATNLPPCA